VSLLALVALVSVTASNKIAEAPKCPSIVSAAISVPATPAAVTHEWICPALELSGQVQSDGLLLDPAFSESAPLADLARPGTSGHATLQGYGADGRTLFTFPFDANGPFKLILPLDAKTQSELRRLRLISGGKAVERTAATGGTPDAEIIDVDSSHVLVIWDSTRFPAIRVRDIRTGRILGSGEGSSTYTQVTFLTSAPEVQIEFSDGLHTASQRFTVFGRS